MTIGQVVPGSVDFLGDRVLISFETQEGVICQIDVRPGTLADSVGTVPLRELVASGTDGPKTPPGLSHAEIPPFGGTGRRRSCMQKGEP